MAIRSINKDLKVKLSDKLINGRFSGATYLKTGVYAAFSIAMVWLLLFLSRPIPQLVQNYCGWIRVTRELWVADVELLLGRSLSRR